MWQKVLNEDLSPHKEKNNCVRIPTYKKCGKVSTNDYLMHHRQEHKRGEPLKCPNCGKGFKTTIAGDTKYRNMEESPQMCQKCG